MEHYKSLLGPQYYFTTDPAEIHKKIRTQIDSKTAIDFSREKMLASCGIDQLCSSLPADA